MENWVASVPLERVGCDIGLQPNLTIGCVLGRESSEADLVPTLGPKCVIGPAPGLELIGRVFGMMLQWRADCGFDPILSLQIRLNEAGVVLVAAMYY